MPLIRSALTWSAQKVSASVKKPQDSGVENLPSQDSSSANLDYSLSRQTQRPLGAEPHSGGTDLVRQEGQLDLQTQSTYPTDESHAERMPPRPSCTHSQDHEQSIENDIARRDAGHDFGTPAPPQTTTYTHPRQQYASAQQDPASEDRDRANYYQAKYYEAQCSQGQLQGQSAQYGDDCGMSPYHQGDGRGRGRRGRRGRGSLIGMLLKK